MRYTRDGGSNSSLISYDTILGTQILVSSPLSTTEGLLLQPAQ